MKKEEALKTQTLALEAIRNLTQILYVIERTPEYELLKKATGISIGRIQTDILDVIYKEYPEIDDLES